MNTKPKQNDNFKNFLPYLVLAGVVLIVLFALKDNERDTKFHAAQAIVLSLGYFILQTIYSFLPITIPFFGTALWGFYIVGIIMGIAKANKEEDPELPVIGGIAKSILGKKIEE